MKKQKVIAILDGDKNKNVRKKYKKFPNYALMKISSYYKKKGYGVEWYSDLFKDKYEKVFASQVFTFSDKSVLKNNMIKGGTGIDMSHKLPSEIEKINDLDYSLYPDFPHALGMLTRGCIRKCKFCFVPKREGKLQPYRDIEQIITKDRREVVLMDNNVLASDYGIKQIEKIVKLGIKIDFNQGIDCRLIDNSVAKLLSKVKWLRPLTMAYDSENQKEHVYRATNLLRWHNTTPGVFFVYICFNDLDLALERVRYLKGLNLKPFVQPEIMIDGNYHEGLLDGCGKIKQEVIFFKRWVNNRYSFYTVPWEDFSVKEAAQSLKKGSKRNQRLLIL